MGFIKISLDEIKKQYPKNLDLVNAGKTDGVFVLKGKIPKTKGVHSIEINFYACKETNVLR